MRVPPTLNSHADVPVAGCTSMFGDTVGTANSTLAEHTEGAHLDLCCGLRRNGSIEGNHVQDNLSMPLQGVTRIRTHFRVVFGVVLK
eukprot:665292-Prorocentrum_minimum.AAC.4